MLADNKSAFRINRQTIRADEGPLGRIRSILATWLPEQGDFPTGSPFEDGVRGYVTKQQISLAGPDGTLCESKSCGQLFNLGRFRHDRI